MLQILRVEFIQIIILADVAGADFAALVFDNRIYRERVILNQLVAYRKKIKFFYSFRSLSDAVIHQHIELQMISLADFDKVCNIKSFEEGYHRIRSVHPKFVRCGSGCFFRFDSGRFHSALSKASIFPD